MSSDRSHGDFPAASRGNAVRSGCVLTASLLVILVAVGSYFGYRYFREAFDVPTELEPYTEIDSVRAQVRSKAPAPPEGTRLDSACLGLYVDGLDSTGAALLATRDVIDSLYRDASRTGDTGIGTLLTSPELYHAIAIIGPSTKRSLVHYLNDRSRSLDEYIWAKTRTLAASGVTRREADSALRAIAGRYFAAQDTTAVNFGGDAFDEWFARIDSLRASGAISDSERSLAAPLRGRILERGLGSIYGLDTDFE